jgi:allatostatin receptor
MIMELENSSTSEKLIRNNISLEMSTENHYTPFELKIAILISITFGITIIVGIVGNSLVLLTILLQKQMRSTTNILILNLAFAELLFILLCVPFTGFNYVLR